MLASKVVAYSESRLLPVKTDRDFRDLIRREADQVFDDSDMMITLKNNILIPNAGIDKSNTPAGEVVLWPKDSFLSAQKLLTDLKKTFKIQKLGLIISDSHCQPLRWGTVGIALGWAGFAGVQDVRGEKDLYGKPMQYTRIAMADDLASAANILMGETNASIPFVLIRKAPVQFTAKKYSQNDYAITLGECIYSGVYKKGL